MLLLWLHLLDPAYIATITINPILDSVTILNPLHLVPTSVVNTIPAPALIQALAPVPLAPVYISVAPIIFTPPITPALHATIIVHPIPDSVVNTIPTSVLIQALALVPQPQPQIPSVPAQALQVQ
jgi:hypothetical protein